MIDRRCPACDSPAAHLHPAVQFEGEVQPCKDKFHDSVTPPIQSEAEFLNWEQDQAAMDLEERITRRG